MLLHRSNFTDEQKHSKQTQTDRERERERERERPTEQENLHYTQILHCNLSLPYKVLMYNSQLQIRLPAVKRNTPFTFMATFAQRLRM